MKTSKFRLAKQHDGKYAVQKKGFFGWRTLQVNAGEYSYSMIYPYDEAVRKVSTYVKWEEDRQRIRNHVVTYVYPPFPDEEPHDNRESHFQ